MKKLRRRVKTRRARTFYSATLLALSYAYGGIQNIPADLYDPATGQVKSVAPCVHEDASDQALPCYWDAEVRGNHTGQSFIAVSQDPWFAIEYGNYVGTLPTNLP